MQANGTVAPLHQNKPTGFKRKGEQKMLENVKLVISNEKNKDGREYEMVSAVYPNGTKVIIGFNQMADKLYAGIIKDNKKREEK